MVNLRTHIATAGLKRSIEENFGLPVELIAPDGSEITENEDEETLKGQVLYDFDGVDPESGDLVSVKETRVSLRITALSRVPLSSETWGIRIPVNPAFPTVLTQYLCSPDEAIGGGQSMGFIMLKLKESKQS